jgi:hypothetical protein
VFAGYRSRCCCSPAPTYSPERSPNVRLEHERRVGLRAGAGPPNLFGEKSSFLLKKGDFEQNENSLAGWINAELFYEGLKAAGPDFTRQKIIGAINKMTDYTAGGLLPGIG